MRFKQITFENYKTYYGHQDIDLSISSQDIEENRNIILMGGLNGAGKTTVLKAIRYVLFGRRGITSTEYERLLANTINNTYFEEGGRECTVSLTLQMDSGEEWKLVVKWRFDKSKGLVSEEREILVKKTGQLRPKKLNVTDMATFNEFIDRIIPYKAAPFFIFDGEEIKELITKQNSDNMKDAIHKITGLDSYKTLLDNLNTLEAQLYKKIASSTTQSTLKKYQKELEELEGSVNKYERFISKTNQQLKKIDQTIQDTTKIRNNKIARNSKSRETVVKQQATISTKLEIKENELDTYYKENIVFIMLQNQIKNLKKEISKEKESKTKKILRENSLEPYNNFMNDLLSKDITPPLTSEQLHQIKKIGEEIWLKEDNQEGEEMITELHDLSSKEESVLKSLPNRDSIYLLELKQTVASLKEEYERLEEEIKAAPESVNIEEETRIISNAQEERGALNSKVRTAYQKLTPLQEKLTNVKNKLTRMSAEDVSSDELNKKLEYVQKTKSFSEEFLTSATKLKAEMIRDEFEYMLNKLFRKSEEFGEVIFDIKKYSIKLYNDRGQEISILDRSAGEMQMISSALIWALIKASDLNLPMVIDTPLGRLDSVHRNRLIENYYKELSDQVIILSTDTEITQEYVDMMKNHSAKQYLLDYDEQHKYTLIRDGYFDIVEVS